MWRAWESIMMCADFSLPGRAGNALLRRGFRSLGSYMIKTTSVKFAASVAVVLIGASAAARADHASISFGVATAGPITTIAASTLPQGMATIGVQVEYVKSRQFSDQQLLNLDEQGIDAHSSDYLVSTSIGFGYGVTNDFTVGVRLPFVERAGLRAVDSNSGNVEQLGSSKGLGDMTVLGKYRAINSVRYAYQAALLFGVKVRTGETGKRDQTGALFTTEHQPGSGSWDVLLGAAASKAIGRASIDASVLYAVAGNGAQDTRLGDRLHYNLAVSYRAGWPEETRTGNTALDLIVELNGEWQGRQKTAGVTEEFSGGTLVYFSPGIRLSAGGNWAVNLSVGVPALQKLRASHADTDYRILSGFSMNF
jgi:hypothetical protein